MCIFIRIFICSYVCFSVNFFCRVAMLWVMMSQNSFFGPAVGLGLCFIRLRSECDDGTFSFISPRTQRHNFVQGGNNLEIKITKFNQDRSLIEMFKCTNKVLEIHWFKCFQHHWTYVPPFSCCWQIVVKIRKPLQQIRCRAVPVICINWCILDKSWKDLCIWGLAEGWRERERAFDFG